MNAFVRPLFVRLHRWFGLATALFLFVAGLTGALIAWDHELDAALNRDFYVARSGGKPLSPLVLAARIEAADPRVQVTYLPLAVEPGHTLQAGVMPRTDPATGQPYAIDFNQIAVDPATGAVQARREWGALSLARLDLIPFIYRLHYSLFLPVYGGVNFGFWVMGVVGIVWAFDSLIALVLAFPSMKSWRKSFAFRVRRGGYPLVFDLHRSGGVWVWGLLLVVAITSISMNLGNPVVRPLVSLFSPLSETPYTNPEHFPPAPPGSKVLARERIVELAGPAARDAGIAAPPGALLYAPAMNVYAVGFFEPGNDHGDAGLGNAWLYWDAVTGKPVAAQLPGRGSLGDLFMQVQFPLHSGRIAGVAGRVAVSVLGIVIAMLSVTGICIWVKKRSARVRAARGASRTAVPASSRPAR
ncbi:MULTISPECIES: PepSY-associated TM helix domain-containing protein [Burkholderia]|nr:MULTISPECIES: PepSY-associated TM helix domain-containing protein [Burkholderia]AVR23527.1 peptidase [Burkholderia multivorans]MBU9495096.1 PepSY domain-containing protein [Burkholderia multivorans]MBU9583984.1 PepSY domain-containing protein [Burkholderia multivorans]MBU9669869.1 PepSY domain-containing protein [Burkholderia multivorans]MBY4795641.1 PepSY domain-containing protein [Burkholderia multivorans]